MGLAKDWPIHETWGMDWVQEIRHLYRLKSRVSPILLARIEDYFKALRAELKVELISRALASEISPN
jgi:hypothetical protein